MEARAKEIVREAAELLGEEELVREPAELLGEEEELVFPAPPLTPESLSPK